MSGEKRLIVSPLLWGIWNLRFFISDSWPLFKSGAFIGTLNGEDGKGEIPTEDCSNFCTGLTIPGKVVFLRFLSVYWGLVVSNGE